MDALLPGRLEMAVEEIAGGVIRREPISVQQEIVHVVRENELLDLHALFAEAGNKIDGLREVDIAIVVTVDEQGGRLPGVHCGDRRRIMRELVELGGGIFSIPCYGWP